jgi:hypothetical protein
VSQSTLPFGTAKSHEDAIYFSETLHKICNGRIRWRRRESLLMNMKKVFKPLDSNNKRI